MKRLLLLSLYIFISWGAYCQALPEPMYPYRLVNDFANIFTDSQKADLEQILKSYNDSTSTQIYVVSVDDLGGYAASDYAIKLGEKWGIGQKGKDNGAVILIKPRKGNSRGDVFIAVGYGLEEKLNDARIGRIIDNDMLPYFKTDDYYTGVKDAVASMINYLSGQFQGDPNNDEQDGGTTIMEVLFIIVLVILLSTKRGRIILLALLSSMGNGGGGNNRGGGRGFGGGGGGRFGGGGAGRGF